MKRTIATLIAPGLGANLAGVTPGVVAQTKSTAEMFISIVPTNPIKSLAEGETLSIIFFALVIGVAVILAGKEGEPAAKVLQSGSEVMLKVVEMVMETAPFGVFALICVLNIGIFCRHRRMLRQPRNGLRSGMRDLACVYLSAPRSSVRMMTGFSPHISSTCRYAR